jgi:hypothetical protein
MKSYSLVKITEKVFISNVSNHYFTLSVSPICLRSFGTSRTLIELPISSILP